MDRSVIYLLNCLFRNWGLKTAFELADVHGGPERNKELDAQVQMRKLGRRLEILRKENEQYANLAKEIGFYPVHSHRKILGMNFGAE